MTRPRWALSADGNRMATASPGAEVFASEIRSQKSCKIKQITVRARSSNWIEQGTPKPKVASSILAGRTNLHY